MKVALCVASRGWGSYRTIAGMLREIQGVSWVEAFAIGRPIPAAQNECARKALADPAVTHLWWIEDDHTLPVGCLDAMAVMLSPEQPVVAVDYLLRSGIPTVIRDKWGEAVLCGLGCTLMLREVFDLLPSPPFQVGNRFTWDGEVWKDMGVPEHAGGQDVFVCRTVRAAGKRIGIVPDMQAGHLERLKTGDHVNFGVDTEICHGGVGLPWYPERRDRMATEYWQGPSGLTLDFDTEVAADQIALREQAGWVRVNKTEAAPALKVQDKAAPEASKGP